MNKREFEYRNVHKQCRDERYFSGNSFWAEVDVQKIGSVEYGLFQINATVKHVNRTSLAISGTMLLTNDFSDDYQGEMKMYYSSLGNNQYVLLPYVLPKKPLCYYMDTTWRQNIQPDLERVSNIPKQVENEPLCPLFKKGKYTVQQYIISKETIPTFFHAGTYKSELNIYEQKSGKLDGTIVIQMKLY